MRVHRAKFSPSTATIFRHILRRRSPRAVTTGLAPRTTVPPAEPLPVAAVFRPPNVNQSPVHGTLHPCRPNISRQQPNGSTRHITSLSSPDFTPPFRTPTHPFSPPISHPHPFFFSRPFACAFVNFPTTPPNPSAATGRTFCRFFLSFPSTSVRQTSRFSPTTRAFSVHEIPSHGCSANTS